MESGTQPESLDQEVSFLSLSLSLLRPEGLESGNPLIRPEMPGELEQARSTTEPEVSEGHELRNRSVSRCVQEGLDSGNEKSAH